MRIPIIVFFCLISTSTSLFSQQIFPENFSAISKGLKKIIYSTKGTESENWRIENITHYNNKCNRIKEEQYRYSNDFVNGFYISPTNYIYKKGKLSYAEHIEYNINIQNTIYHFDTLQKIHYNTFYFYSPSGVLERIEKNKDSISLSNPWPEDGACTSTYIYKNNLLTQVDSICDLGGGCEGKRKVIAYDDKKHISSITLISGIVNNQCEPTSYIAPYKFTEFLYNDKKQIVKERIKNINIYYPNENDSMTYNYFYTGAKLDSIQIVLIPEEYHTCIGSIRYSYDHMQRIKTIFIRQIGNKKDDELKYEFVY